MALKQHLATKLSQKLVMTPSLQQAIKMLQMNKLEIETLIRKELEKNVVLEVESPNSPDAQEIKSQEQEGITPSSTFETDTPAKKDENPFDNIDVEAFFADYLDTPTTYKTKHYENSEELPSFEQTLSVPINLNDHLMWQLDLSVNETIPKEIGKAILGNLNKSGYLKATIEEIVGMDPTWNEEIVKKVLKIIQGFDPSGIAASDLKECLIIQLHSLEERDPVAEEIIEKYLDRLERRDYDPIIKNLEITTDELKEKLELIKHLDPKPGLRYNQERIIYIEPEVFITKENGEYKISLNDDGLPKLRINPYYEKLIKFKELGDEQAVEYIQDKMKSAMWLLKSFDQRQNTIYKVAESILKYQRDFFDYGDEHLKPMVLRDIADDIGMHESTVSRVVNNKYMHTPSGVYEMKYFFQRGLTSDSGDDVSSLIVKKKIESIISNEDENKPLSDTKIATMLEKEGIQIARRTVAKYREELKIPSSSQRKRKI